MTATPLRDASPAHKLAHLAARRAGVKLSDDQRSALDRRAADLVDKAGALAEAGIIVANYTLTESAGAILSAFSAAIEAFAAEPLPQVREGDDPVPPSYVYKLMRIALDLGWNAAETVADVAKVVTLYRAAYRAVGALRGASGPCADIVAVLPHSMLEDTDVLGVVECYCELGHLAMRAARRQDAIDLLDYVRKNPRRELEFQLDDLVGVLFDAGRARAGRDELLAAEFDMSGIDKLLNDSEEVVLAAGLPRSLVALTRMVAAIPEAPGVSVATFAETLAEFNRLAAPKAVTPDTGGEEVF